MYTYSSENGWGTLASSLDDAHKDLFAQLKALDFMHTEPEVLHCRAGVAQVYARYIAPGKKALPLAFDFCCVLTVGGFLYPIGLKTLEDVFAFLKEIDAHPVVPRPVTLADAERKAVQGYVEAIVDQMEQHVDALLSVAAWRKTIERLALALEALPQRVAPGQPRPADLSSFPGVPVSQQNANTALPAIHEDVEYNTDPHPADNTATTSG
jgi:hypothetical protein